MTPRSLYFEVVNIAQDYLGPTAERFIERLIDFHFDKKPDELNRKDIPKLAEWLKVSLGLLTEDKALIDDCEKRIMMLKGRGKKQLA